MNHCAVLVSALLLAGCAGSSIIGGGGPAAPVPAYQVGDRWTYHGEDGFRLRQVWSEVDEVTAAGPAGITVRVTRRGDATEGVRTEQWPAPGRVAVGGMCDEETREFVPALQRWNFPLTPGTSWSQWVNNRHGQEGGQVNRYVRVGGWEKVTTAAGTFDAIRLSVYMLLDDADMTRWQTNCNYVAWYAPSVRAVVREEREAYYMDKAFPHDRHRTQHGFVELTGYTPGRS